MARQAVALDALRHGLDLDPDRIVLTASTSEAYGFLFKLLCDPGDEVLVPRPSYPLFEHLSSLDGVRAVPYTLDYYGRWSIDVDTLTRAITPRTRAILVVSPNNPTGSRLSAGELDTLAALCEQHGLALIGDEVFAEYTLNDAGGRCAFRGRRERACQRPLAAARADVWPGRIVEVDRPAAGEAGVDRDRRARRAGRAPRSTGWT